VTPATGYVAALAGFDRMTTARLTSLLAGRTPEEGYAIATGEARAAGPVASLFRRDPELAERWRADGVERTAERSWQECLDAGVSVVVPGDPEFPAQLLDDPRCPAVLFVRGNLGVLDARRVGIVGTRNATQRGRETAARFGYELASEEVVVVSGLARGIDGSAHRGALAVDGSRPVAIVGNGPDRPYPKQNTELWNEVAERGALISEWPPGTQPDAFRFPLRNRILAALVEVLVVVESRERGGSLITAREAAERGVDVFAVPGSLQSRASAGTNQLLRDGAAPATDVTDVLVALGLDQCRAGRSRFDSRQRPRGDEVALLETCRAEPRTIEALVLLHDMTLGDVAMSIARLERSGWLRETGGWFESVDEWAELA
jgi:DNA processing protein